MNSMDRQELIAKLSATCSLDALSVRLRPELGLGDYGAETTAHDGFNNYSHNGFLGIDEDLVELVEADARVVESYGLTHAQIAAVLRTAIKKSKVPNKNYSAQGGVITAGYQNCPWFCAEKDAGASDMMIIMLKDEEVLEPLFNSVFGRKGWQPSWAEKSVVVTEMHPHLIEQHYFFEGRETPFRADPELLIDALNLSKPRKRFIFF